MNISEKVIVFDLNDTLINTFYTAFKRNEYCYKQMGLKGPALKEFEIVFGGEFPQCLEKWLPSNRVEEFLEYYPASRQSVPYQSFGNLTSLFEKLKGQGKSIVILTNTSREQFDKKAFDIKLDTRLVDLILCNAQKPSENSLITVKDHFQVNKTDMVFIGDDLIDCQTADKYGVKFLAVLTGLVSAGKFAEQGISNQQIIESVKELI